jgi:hypothetical protein
MGPQSGGAKFSRNDYLASFKLPAEHRQPAASRRSERLSRTKRVNALRGCSRRRRKEVLGFRLFIDASQWSQWSIKSPYSRA